MGRVSAHYLHGAGLVVAYERRSSLNGDGLRQRHGTVRLISGEVLQTAGVCLFLSILKRKQRRRRRNGGRNAHSAALRSESAADFLGDVVLPAAPLLQRPA